MESHAGAGYRQAVEFLLKVHMKRPHLVLDHLGIKHLFIANGAKVLDHDTLESALNRNPESSLGNSVNGAIEVPGEKRGDADGGRAITAKSTAINAYE
jgi:hypothetical protein